MPVHPFCFKQDKSGADQIILQYVDVYCLLSDDSVQQIIGTPVYLAHKPKRFPAADRVISIRENEIFLLNNAVVKSDFIKR